MANLAQESHGEIIICRINRKIFAWSLVWPSEGTELNPGINYKIKIAAMYVITGLTILLSAVGLFFIIRIKDHLGGPDLSALVAIYSMYYMLFLFIQKQHDIALILHNLSEFTKFGRPPGFEKLDKTLNFFAKFITTYEIVGMITYKSIKLIKKPVCRKIETEYGSKGYYCGLGIPKWMPCDIHFSPVYELFVIYDYFVSLLFSKMISQISFHVLEITYHTVLRIEHLNSLIKQCFDSENSETFSENLKKCMSYHRHILNLTAAIDNTFSTIMLVHFLLTGAVCAFIEKSIIEGHGLIMGIFHFVLWIAALFYVCLGGQRIIDSTESVAEALWTSQWYKADLSVQKCLHIMLMRAQKGSRLKAGPFGVLCFPLFVAVIKMSYSILCVLTS